MPLVNPQRTLRLDLVGLSFVALVVASVASPSIATGFDDEIIPLLDKYCYRCHGEEEQKGDVQLSSFRSQKSILKEHKLWQDVLYVLKEEEMPEDDPLPTSQERAQLIDWLETTLNEIDWSLVKNPGHTTIPRLTKAEYNNTMRDLLGIDTQPGSFFSEDGEGQSGFNNDRDNLFITPVLMEKYFAAAERSLDALIALSKEPIELRLQSEDMFMTETRETPKDFGDGFLGYVLNRGQMTLYDSIDFPYDGFYRFEAHALSTEGPTGARLRINDEIKGDIEVLKEEADLYAIEAFVPKGSHQVAWNIQVPSIPYKPKKTKAEEAYKQIPKEATSAIEQASEANAPRYPLPDEAPNALKRLVNRYNAASQRVQKPYEELKFVRAEGDPEYIVRRKEQILQYSVYVEDARDALIEHLNMSEAEFERALESSNRKRIEANRAILAEVAHITEASIPLKLRPQSVAIDWIRISGPFRPSDAPENPQVFIAEPGDRLSEDQAALEVLQRFAQRAFRKRVPKREVDKYFALYKQSASSGQSYEDSLKLALTGVLVSPHFLYRPELAKTRSLKAYQVDNYSLASRLSYFLWMSMPDDELFDLAKRNRIRKPAELEVQVRRMLADPRSSQAMETFLGQWLGIESLGVTVLPDAKAFKQFTPSLNEAMKAETYLAFQSLLERNGSLIELLDSNTAFLNETLARHYSIKGVSGPEMRPVSLQDPARGGLLGMGAILTATSNPARTNPVSRGKWVLETLLGSRIPEPPADAGILPENAGQVKGQTLRQEFEEHRRNPSCVDCHEKIDPIGFGLENFDAIGRYRTTENGVPIDSAGVMPDGAAFNGPVELKRYLLSEKKDAFIRNLVERMLSFALGRELKHYDEAAILKIVEALEATDYSAQTLITEVVMSYPFQYQHPDPDNEQELVHIP